jgi:hypothetical protein
MLHGETWAEPCDGRIWIVEVGAAKYQQRGFLQCPSLSSLDSWLLVVGNEAKEESSLHSSASTYSCLPPRGRRLAQNVDRLLGVVTTSRLACSFVQWAAVALFSSIRQGSKPCDGSIMGSPSE